MNRFSFALLLTLAAMAHAGPAEDVAAWAGALNSAAPLQPTRVNPFDYGQPWIRIGVQSQTLSYYDGWGRETQRYLVSTAKNGLGEQEGSFQTPRGWHRICQKIGDGAAENTIIFRREVTPWKYTPELHQQYPEKDWILTRILWLCGMEPGKNQGGSVDSFDRSIYIHGAGEHVPFGTPSSLGCIRMRNPDVIRLFDAAPVGTDVLIEENS